MYPQDNLPSPNDFGFLDVWENEAAKQFDPLADNPLDPLSNILNAAEQHIEDTTPIGHQPPDILLDVFPEKTNEDNDEISPDTVRSVGEADLHTLGPEGTTEIERSWSSSDFRSKSPLSDINHGRSFQSRVPPPRFSRPRSGAGLSYSSGQDTTWCPKTQEMTNIDYCQGCQYYNEDESDHENVCTHPDR